MLGRCAREGVLGEVCSGVVLGRCVRGCVGEVC